jgi:hypothetical protein
MELVPIGMSKLQDLINDGTLESRLVHGKRWISYASLKKYALGET